MESMTEAQLLDELRAALHRDEAQGGILTTEEIAERLGMSVLGARAFIKRLIREGKMEPSLTRRPNMSGRVGTVPGYRWVGEG